MNYHNITTDDMLNGDGLRTVLWVAGCGLHCPHCQNPETHDKESGILFDEQAEKELFQKLAPNYIRGLTLSGGHPLEDYNYPEVLRICKKLKQEMPNKTIWLYTGYVWENIKDLEIMQYVDVVCDGPFVQDLKDVKLHWVGSSNQRVIDVKKSLEQDQIVLLK